MKFKELIKQSYEDLKNLTINWFNVLSLTVIIFILSNIVTRLLVYLWVYSVVHIS